MSHSPMHLTRHPLPRDRLTPLAAFLALRPAGASLLLESCDQGERVGRHSFVLIEGPAECRMEAPAKGWVEALRGLAGDAPAGTLHDPSAVLPVLRETLPVGVGCAGYLGFEAMGALEPTLKLPARNRLCLPGLWVCRFDPALVLDHLHPVADTPPRIPAGKEVLKIHGAYAPEKTEVYSQTLNVTATIDQLREESDFIQRELQRIGRGKATAASATGNQPPVEVPTGIEGQVLLVDQLHGDGGQPAEAGGIPVQAIPTEGVHKTPTRSSRRRTRSSD